MIDYTYKQTTNGFKSCEIYRKCQVGDVNITIVSIVVYRKMLEIITDFTVCFVVFYCQIYLKSI